MSKFSAEVSSILAKKFDDAGPEEIYNVALNGLFRDQMAVVSSFGVESAIALSIVSELNPATPVIFADTGMHFPQTRQYVEELTEFFGLTNVMSIGPSEDERKKVDPLNNMWKRDTDGCCKFRKVVPLNHALVPFRAWATGRKRYHGAERSELPAFEFVGGKFKVNPLINLDEKDIKERFEAIGAPRHPMEAMGYSSIGCWPCTEPNEDGNARSGRWKNLEKTECGIHRTTLIQHV